MNDVHGEHEGAGPYGDCPRCGEPMTLPPGESRMVDEPAPPLKICGPCCSDEAIRDARRLPPVEPSAWPVTDRLGWTTAV